MENRLCRRANHFYDFARRPDGDLSLAAAFSPDGIFPRLPTGHPQFRKTEQEEA
jgi:hypothetical protein